MRLTDYGICARILTDTAALVTPLRIVETQSIQSEFEEKPINVVLQVDVNKARRLGPVC